MKTEFKKRRPQQIAFIATPGFRHDHPDIVSHFIRTRLFPLSQICPILATGNTFKFLSEILNQRYSSLSSIEQSEIKQAMNISSFLPHNYKAWQQQLLDRVTPKLPGTSGIVEILVELVEGRLAGIIHLTHPHDIETKADSDVLWREANVHGIPIAHNVTTANKFIKSWSSGSKLTERPGKTLANVMKGIEEGSRVLAMIAHDGKKLDICRFAVEHAERILAYDYILTTGATGRMLTEILRAKDPNVNVDKIKICESGPDGGDIKIAHAIIKGLCQTVIFFQDPLASHPHEVDIRLFGQIIVSNKDHPIELATNAAAASLIV
ncbi:MAG: hypothetical protein JKY93_06495 [Gammaproteobacteria bacterium]|nr:hypothetical protein [Gammaproteobacteria bacterium]